MTDMNNSPQAQIAWVFTCRPVLVLTGLQAQQVLNQLAVVRICGAIHVIPKVMKPLQLTSTATALSV